MKNINYDQLKELEAAFEAVLKRIETGETTIEDARIVRSYVAVSRQLIGNTRLAEEAAGRVAA
ncbi:MAG TPA: hypothetical protein ENJ91_10700 [Rhodobacteraceae bacterium]|nr:hypothetical protein [Paracoccaceae bacterium]